MKIVDLDIFRDGGTRIYTTDGGIKYCQDFRMRSIKDSDKVEAYPSVGQFFYGYPREDSSNIITDLDLIQEIKKAVVEFEALT